MTRIIAFLAVILLANSAGAASTTSTNVDITVTHAGGSVTALPTPPAGFHWVQTFGDEFSTAFPNSGTSSSPVTLDTSAWQIDHWCGLANYSGSYSSPNYGCAATNTSSVTVNGGVLSLAIQATAPATRTIIDTHMVAGDQGHGYQPLTNPVSGGFVQRFGYFVYDAKLPTCASNEFDLESFARDTWAGGQYGELGWVSGVNAGCNYSALRPYEGDQNHSFHFISANNPGVDITQAFHQYGLLWVNDGSAHGSVTVYFDGTAMTSPYQLVSPAWDNGLFFDVYWDPCVGCEGGTGVSPMGSTMQFDWIRAYQLAPN
jgi:hypothetical protein